MDSWDLAALKEIRRRYFRKTISSPNGVVVHHGDCLIYAVDDRAAGDRGGHCSCGLIHDLRALPSEIAEVIFPNYWQDREASCYYPSNRQSISEEEFHKFMINHGFKYNEDEEESVDLTLVKEIFPELSQLVL